MNFAQKLHTKFGATLYEVWLLRTKFGYFARIAYTCVIQLRTKFGPILNELWPNLCKFWANFKQTSSELLAKVA